MLYGFLCYKNLLCIQKGEFSSYEDVVKKTKELEEIYYSVIEVNLDVLYRSFVDNFCFKDLDLESFASIHDELDEPTRFALDFILGNYGAQLWVAKKVKNKLNTLKNEVIKSSFNLATLRLQPFDFSNGLFEQTDLYFDILSQLLALSKESGACY